MVATVKTTVIQEPSSASTNIQLDASGNTYLVPVSGLVGIGTTAPNRLLTLSGSGVSTRVQLNNTVSGKNFGLYAADTGDSTINYGTASALLFTQSGSETMRIDTSGNLLVGTTAVINASNAILQVLNVNGGRPGINVGNSVGSTATNCIIFTNSNGTIGTIQTSGTATSFNTSSDYRLKENVTPMTTGLATVSALKPVNYDWISDKSEGEGFIAHELQAVIPYAVTGEKDAVDADGKPVYQGVDYSKVVVHLVAAIQEQQATITALTNRIAALEAK